MNADQRILRLRQQGLEWRLVEGEIVAIDLLASNYLAINQSGACLWALLVRGAGRDELRDHLSGEFGLGPQQAEHDLDAFLASLAERGLLEHDENP